jgi:hypothetical protein
MARIPRIVRFISIMYYITLLNTNVLSQTVNYPRFAKIVGRHLKFHPIP